MRWCHSHTVNLELLICLCFPMAATRIMRACHFDVASSPFKWPGGNIVLWENDVHSYSYVGEWVTTCFQQSAPVWQSRTAKTCFDSWSRRTDSSSIWHYSWTGRSLRNTNAACTKTTGKTDCGCFVIPWAVHLAYSSKPQSITLDQKQLRSHLQTCLLFFCGDHF